MSKKIVIIPTFCDAHIIKYQIPNIIETINPDYIIYNEGRFPAGPESNTNVTAEFLKEYTLDGWRGFDFEELTQIIEENQKKYSDTTIILNKMNYPVETTSAIDCFTLACTNFKELGIDIERYKLLKSTFETSFDAVHVVEFANKPLRKSRPKRSILVLAAGLAAFLITSLAAIAAVYSKKVNWKEVLRSDK